MWYDLFITVQDEVWNLEPDSEVEISEFREFQKPEVNNKMNNFVNNSFELKKAIQKITINKINFKKNAMAAREKLDWI